MNEFKVALAEVQEYLSTCDISEVIYYTLALIVGVVFGIYIACIIVGAICEFIDWLMKKISRIKNKDIMQGDTKCQYYALCPHAGHECMFCYDYDNLKKEMEDADG